MKLILAIIRPAKLAAVQAALNHPDVCLMTVSEVFGYGGRERGPVEMYRGRKVQRPVSKLRVGVMVNDSYLDYAVEAIRAAAFPGSSGPIGDDQLFVMGPAEGRSPAVH